MDAELRVLEREAAQGGHEAHAKLNVARRRAGLVEAPPEPGTIWPIHKVKPGRPPPVMPLKVFREPRVTPNRIAARGGAREAHGR